jgi:membrane protein
MNYQAWAKAVFFRLNKITGGVLSILWTSAQSFVEARATEAASSIAYYALFSIFPLVIFVIAFASSFLEDETVQQLIFTFVEDTLPEFFQDLVKGNIEQALALRGSVQILGMIGLLWAASAVFTNITHNLDRAWHVAQERNFILGRLVGLSMIGAITTGLILLWIISTTLLNVLPVLEIQLWNGESIHLYNSYTWSLMARFLPYFLIFFTFINLYKWVPNTTIKWSEAAWGAAVAAMAWELSQRGFGWYLTSGWARYQLVYGSLGAVIAFMLWLYVSSIILLYGAHLSAAIALHTRINIADEKD